MSKCWYAKGLQTTCVPGCSQCCGDGWILLTQHDLHGLAEATGLDESAFREKYVEANEGHDMLKMRDSGRCPFVTAQGCVVYPARPVQCRTFPLWPEYVRDLERWKMAAARCPGVGKGKLHTKEEIEQNMHDVSVARMQAKGRQMVSAR